MYCSNCKERLALYHLGFKDKHGRIWLNSHDPKTPVSRVELNTVEKYLLPNCFHAGEQYTLYSMTRVVSSYMWWHFAQSSVGNKAGFTGVHAFLHFACESWTQRQFPCRVPTILAYLTAVSALKFFTHSSQDPLLIPVHDMTFTTS